MSPSTSVTIRIPNETLEAIQIEMSKMPQAKNISTVIKESLDLWLNASNPTVDRQYQSESTTSIIPYGYGNPTNRPLPDTWQEGYCEAMDTIDDFHTFLSENESTRSLRQDIESIIGEPSHSWLKERKKAIDRLNNGEYIEPDLLERRNRIPTIIERLEYLEKQTCQQKDDRQLDRPSKNKKGFG